MLLWPPAALVAVGPGLDGELENGPDHVSGPSRVGQRGQVRLDSLLQHALVVGVQVNLWPGPIVETRHARDRRSARSLPRNQANTSLAEPMARSTNLALVLPCLSPPEALLRMPTTSLSLSRGSPLELVDTTGNFLSLSNKLLFLSADLDSHYIDDDVERAMCDFADHHGIEGGHVRVNEYAPLDELGRVLSNGRVNILLRLSFGLLGWLGYVLMVNRVFGGDHYNPFADTVNVFSNHKGIALHEMGHLLDFRRRRFPGLYSLLRLVPGVALYQEYLASLYAIQYLDHIGDHDEELRAYRILFPAYSTYVLGFLAYLLPNQLIRTLALPFVALGHVVGNVMAQQRIEVLKSEGVECEGLGAQWKDEVRRAEHMISTKHRRGRLLVGMFLGAVIGSSVCGFGTLIGAAVGYGIGWWVKRDER